MNAEELEMADKPEDIKARADAKLRKEQDRTREADQVHTENAASARAFDERTASLKAQRLARDAAEKRASAPTLRPSGGHAPASKKQKRAPKLIANPDEVPGG
jgi:hypothetical protein